MIVVADVDSNGNWERSDLIAIRRARARGVRTVQYETRSVTYASDAELAQVEADIIQSLNRQNQAPKQSRVRGVSGF